MLEVTKENFEKEVKESELPVIIDFYADWCGPCKTLAPTFEKLSKDYDGKLKFGKCNTEHNSEIAEQFSVRGIPCLVVLKKGEEVDRIVGALPENSLKKKIEGIMEKL